MIAAALAAAIAGCGSDDDPDPQREAEGGPTIEDPAAGHVHGLDVDPRGGALLVATHTGLFRAAPGESAVERVGDRYHDLMGFTVAGRGRFLASGHPDGRERLPPFLGLVESRDRGRSWSAVSLQGEVDFHVLEAADDRIYAFGSEYDSRTATMRVSGDAGETWDEVSPPEALYALAIDPEDPNRAVAAGEQAVHRTGDAGRTWRPLGAPVGLLAWPDGDALYSATPDGIVARSDNGGDSFEQVGELPGEPAALHAESARVLDVALHDGTILRSRDGGATWAPRASL